MQVRNFLSLLALRYLGFSNVLDILSVRAIPTYRYYQHYDNSIDPIVAMQHVGRSAPSW